MKTVEQIAEQALDCVLDSARGIYIGQGLAKRFGEYLGEEDRDILLAGPDHELYFDTWSDVIDNTGYVPYRRLAELEKWKVGKYRTRFDHPPVDPQLRSLPVTGDPSHRHRTRDFVECDVVPP